MPDWRAAPVRLVLDLADKATRVWVEGRCVLSSDARLSADSVLLELPLGCVPGESCLVALPVDDRLLPVDLRPYEDELLREPGKAASGDLPEPFAGLFAFHALDRTFYRGFTEYVNTPSLCAEPARLLLHVPMGMYDRVHVLCSLADTASGPARAACRFIRTGRGHAVSTEFTVPGPYAEMLADGTFHVTVPMDPCAFQDFLDDDALTVEICRPLAHDENRYPYPSHVDTGLLLHAVTLERAPFELRVVSHRTGHIFEAPDVPELTAELRNITAEAMRIVVTATFTDAYGVVHEVGQEITLAGGATASVPMRPEVRLPGVYRSVVRAELADASRSLVRHTTCALLPPDTRKAQRDSPFGMWCFFEGHNGVSAETAGPLFRMAGVRWTLAQFVANRTAEDAQAMADLLARYDVGLTCANVAFLGNSSNDKDIAVEDWLAKMRAMPPVARWLVFWETNLGREQQGTPPLELFGGERRPLTDSERATFERIRAKSLEYVRRVREEFPKVSLIYGSGHPAFIGELMASGYPRELVDGLGLDFDMFLSMPELQPGPLYAPFCHIYFARRLMERYGYADKALLLTEAIYSSQTDGWLTERQQADYYVRSHLLGLAGGVVHFGMTAELYDPGSSYFYSHYGPVGLCHMPPEMNPRESFCAYSTMTRMLDQVTFECMLPTPSPSLFALRFRKPDGTAVDAFWTVRGRRTLMVDASADGDAAATDLFANTTALSSGDDGWTIDVTPSPVYVTGLGDVRAIRAGEPVHRPAPDATTPLVPAADLAAWQAESGEDAWMREQGEFNGGSVTVPYRRADSALSVASDGARVEISLPDGPFAVQPTVGYTVLRPPAPVIVSGRPRALGVSVRGNSSWSRIAFELTDAEGTVWRSLQSSAYVDFDGERYVETVLPWPTDDETPEATGFDAWRTRPEGHQPVWPIALTAVIIEMRTHVVRAAELAGVPEKVFAIGDVVVADEVAVEDVIAG